jgi:hypothetical protein
MCFWWKAVARLRSKVGVEASPLLLRSGGAQWPKNHLAAYSSGVIVEGFLGVFCSGGFLRCLLFLDAVHKFLRFAVFVRRPIFLFLFHVNSL